MKVEIVTRKDGTETVVEYEYKKRHEDDRPMVLDVLLQAQATKLADLAFRYGCRARNCGVCTVDVNGRPRVACRARVNDGDRISPLSTLPVLSDLVVRRDGIARQMRGRIPLAGQNNDLNVEAHRTVTGVEIDQQLHENDESLQDYSIVCTFGTGGTSGGLSKYFDEQYNKKGVHVIFPPDQQDVAGIRTVGNADGLKYYNPDKYAGKHQIDFEQAKPLLKFMVEKGHDMGESSALELYAALQMIYNNGGKFVVMICDGIDKYRKNFEKIGNTVTPAQVSQEEVASKASEYDKVIWVHTQYTPREEGIEILAKSLGIDKSKIVVPNARTAQQLLSGQQVPEEIDQVLQESKGKSLMVCMAGRTSLMAANVLAEKGIQTDSLTGGITGLAETKTKDLSQIIEQVSQF